MSDAPRFFNERSKVSFQKNRLPHWEQDGCSYFITFRLADSLPASLLKEWERERSHWLRHHPKPWDAHQEMEYHRRFTGARERWLDALYGECYLRAPPARVPLSQMLNDDENQIWSYVIMPNHVHVLVTLQEDQLLSLWLQQLKGASARAINQHLDRTGALWSKDYFDRLIRDQRHFNNCARYIRRNPLKAKLADSEFTLFESVYVRQLLEGESWDDGLRERD